MKVTDLNGNYIDVNELRRETEEAEKENTDSQAVRDVKVTLCKLFLAQAYASTMNEAIKLFDRDILQEGLEGLVDDLREAVAEKKAKQRS